MIQLEHMPDPKPTQLVNDQAIWVVIWWSRDYQSGTPLHGTFYGKQQAIEWAQGNRFIDESKPVKLYRLHYGENA